MLTNDLKSLQVSQGRRAFLLSRNGRIEADILVLHDQEKTWMVIDRQDAAALIEELDKFIFTEDVKFRLPRHPEHEHKLESHLSLHGPGSVKLLDEISDQSFDPLEPLEHRAVTLFDQPGVVYRFDQTGSPGLHLFTTMDAMMPIFKALLQQGEKTMGQGSNADQKSNMSRPISPIGWEAFDTARIEAGTPMFAIDFSQDHFPHETSMIEQTVSFNKGCYPGQEIVARMQNLGHPSKLLVGLRIDVPGRSSIGRGAITKPASKTGDESGAKSATIGQITSSAHSPALHGAAIGMAMINWAHREQGTHVRIAPVGQDGQSGEATVQPLGSLIES